MCEATEISLPLLGCVSQTSAVVAALCTATLSLLATMVRIVADVRMAQHRQRFEEEQARRQADHEVKLKKYVDNREWLNDRKKERLVAVVGASNALTRTMNGVKRLLSLGPAFDDITMTTETAGVLGEYGRFKEHLESNLLPRSIEECAKDLSTSLAELFLTLSPRKGIRESDKRKSELAQLMGPLQSKVDMFQSLRRGFEQDPDPFMI